jgi:hypothetical protein
MIYVDLGKLEQDPRGADQEQDARLDPSHISHIPQPLPIICTFLYCKLVRCAFYTFILQDLFLILPAKVANFVPFLMNWEQASGVGKVTFNIVAGLLPPVAYRIFDFLFERMIFQLSRYKGAATRSRLQNAILARHFAFLVIWALIIFTLLGVGLSTCDIILALGVRF